MFFFYGGIIIHWIGNDNKIYTEEQLVKVNKILRLYKSFLILESNYRTKDPFISDLFLD